MEEGKPAEKHARRSTIERKADKLAQLKKIKAEIAALEKSTAERIGRLAVKAGLGELGIPDAKLKEEFDGIAQRFRSKP